MQQQLKFIFPSYIGEPNLQSLWRPEYAAYMIEGILALIKVVLQYCYILELILMIKDNI